MTRIIRLIFLLVMILLFSCEDNRYFTNCDNCTTDEPLTTTLKADIGPENSSGVLVMLWEGRIEDNILFDSTKVFGSTYEKIVPLNRTYTVTATYIIDNKTYTAIDSATPRVKYTEDMCQEPCYYTYDKSFNVKLKYTK